MVISCSITLFRLTLLRRLFSLSISNLAALSPAAWAPQLQGAGGGSVAALPVSVTISVWKVVGVSGVGSASMEALMLSAYTSFMRL